MTPTTLVLASIGGMLPAMTWLYFWLQEDARHPEPKWRIALTFIGGMGAVLAVLPIEVRTYDVGNMTAVFVLWAFLEEAVKLAVCYAVALASRDVDEPLDPLIYLITAALGFAAMENTLFLLQPLMRGDALDTIVTGNLRYIGASLLHVVSSAAIGVFMALSFYKDTIRKRLYVFAGFVTAVVLHAAFNLLIIKETGRLAFATFALVWIAIVILMAVFEKVKTINPRNSTT